MLGNGVVLGNGVPSGIEVVPGRGVSVCPGTEVPGSGVPVAASPVDEGAAPGIPFAG